MVKTAAGGEASDAAVAGAEPAISASSSEAIAGTGRSFGTLEIRFASGALFADSRDVVAHLGGVVRKSEYWAGAQWASGHARLNAACVSLLPLCASRSRCANQGAVRDAKKARTGFLLPRPRSDEDGTTRRVA